MHDLIRAVARRLGQKQRPVEEAVHIAFTEITEALMQGDRVNLSSFGTFRVKTRAARLARNPRTGAAIPIPARKVVSFRPWKELKNRVNAPPGQGT
ncbi:MAG TPA: HU family DNA-binding protein [Gemmataceae bacterium]|nr:HU family DNA-binding protein [Gemmataceae bacterium]